MRNLYTYLPVHIHKIVHSIFCKDKTYYNLCNQFMSTPKKNYMEYTVQLNSSTL